MENAFGNGLKGMNPLNLSMGVIYQKHSIQHAYSAPSFMNDTNRNPVSMRIFSARVGHATMAANPEAWSQGSGSGYVLVPANTAALAMTEEQQKVAAAEGVLSYSLKPWTPIMEAYANDPTVFDPRRVDAVSYSTRDGTLKLKDGLPRSLAAEGRVATPARTAGHPTHSRFPLWPLNT